MKKKEEGKEKKCVCIEERMLWSREKVRMHFLFVFTETSFAELVLQKIMQEVRETFVCECITKRRNLV